MPYDLTNKLVIGVSSRALFDLEEENRIYEEKGLEEYTKYQINNEEVSLKKGTAYPLIEGLLKLNEKIEPGLVEVIILSKNSPETGLRVFNTINSLGINITRAVFSGGESLTRYLEPFQVDLFLSKNADDVQAAINAGVAAGIIYDPPEGFNPDTSELRLAFDGDAVLFSDESEKIFQEQGLDAFEDHEKINSKNALPEGPFAKLLKTISKIHAKETGQQYIRIAIVTARSSPAHKRVILTLREWGVKVDEAFFLGGISKDKILKAYNAHIFFDDQDTHLKGTREFVPSAKVPYRTK